MLYSKNTISRRNHQLKIRLLEIKLKIEPHMLLSYYKIKINCLRKNKYPCLLKRKSRWNKNKTKENKVKLQIANKNRRKIKDKKLIVFFKIMYGSI